MTPRTRRIATTAIGLWHDDLLAEGRMLSGRDFPKTDELVSLRRRKIAARLRDARYALRELNRPSLVLPRNECE